VALLIFRNFLWVGLFLVLGGTGGGGMSVCVGVIAIAPVPIRKRGGSKRKAASPSCRAFQGNADNTVYVKTHIQCFQWLSVFGCKNGRKTQDVVSAPQPK